MALGKIPGIIALFFACMDFLVVICLNILLLYMLKIGMYKHYWEHYPVFEKPEFTELTRISVVVAFRNEMENLPGLLNSLEIQKYPADLREILLVDDHSTDESAQLVQAFANRHPGIRYLHNRPEECGKKAALLRGIRHASHKLIVTTDADCTMDEYWLSNICGILCKHEPGMVIGLVDMVEEKGFFARFQYIEFLSLIAAGAAAVAGGRPIFCNAANLAFKKELAFSLPDPMIMALTSGDDTLFMHRIKHSRKVGIILLKSTYGTVKTRGAQNLMQFINQRIRWASKSRYYTDRDTLYTAGLVLAVSFVMVGSMVMMINTPYIWVYPVILAGKSLSDYFFLRSFMQFYNKRLPALQFIVFEMIYPVYILSSFAGGVLNRYAWKGRRYA
jgi:poly-beta-1,6-N-acetyl-D-glucosamine synthase